jgi:hypothetical protein
MMSFVFLFDRVHYRNRFSAWLRGDKLMNHQELEQIQAIWSACQDN